MRKPMQTIIRAAFLLLFAFLVIIGRPQLWMAILLSGTALSFYFSRFYCGWICPSNTVMHWITRLKAKLHIKDRELPHIFTVPLVRYLSLVLFISVFIFMAATGKRIPVLPILFTVSILLVLLFPEELWHRYLCPYGILLSMPSSIAKKSVQIDADSCNNCDACIRICPANAVVKASEKNEIRKADCLVCMECSRKCKKNAISYR